MYGFLDVSAGEFEAVADDHLGVSFTGFESTMRRLVVLE